MNVSFFWRSPELSYLVDREGTFLHGVIYLRGTRTECCCMGCMEMQRFDLLENNFIYLFKNQDSID
ncbi:MAG: hypothetical protein FWH18_06600 [Marinilabiliaceae bacterium]|nr:hypothetical protein [Marinilabiliaceae bacterium]